jgi:hypothetical protein
LERPGRSRSVAVGLILSTVVALGTVSAFAIGDPELSPQYGGESPAGFDPAEAPGASPEGVAALAELGVQAELAEDQRQSPTAEAERQASRAAFTDASSAEAAGLLEDEFAAVLDAASIDAADLSDGGEVTGFLDDFTMRVNRPGTAQDALVESPVPLRVENELGVESPVDLSLDPGVDTFKASNPLVEVTLPRELEDGAHVASVGVYPAADAAGPSEAHVLNGGKAALYHEAVTDTDVVLAPVPTGLEASWLVRSPQAPAQQRLEFDLPQGGEILIAPDGGADLVDGATRLGRVLPAHAIDAQGQPVRVSYETDGDALVLNVDHQGEDLAYPVFVDPVIEDWLGPNRTNSWYHGYNYDGLNQWFWSSNQPTTNAPLAPRTTCYTPVSCYKPAGTASPPYGYGLHAYVFPGSPYQIPAGTYGEWIYDPPGSTTQVSQAVLGPTFYSPRSSTQPNPYFYMGIWADGIDNWTHAVGVTSGLVANYTTLTAGANRPNSGRNNVAVGYFSPTAVPYLSAWRDFAVGGATITLTDPEPPTITDMGQSGTTDWISEGNFTVQPSAADAGLGIKSLTLTVPKAGSSATQTRTHTCTGRKANPCPATWTLPSGADAGFGYSTSDADPTASGSQPMPEGTNTVTLTATDALGKTTVATRSVNIDRSAPRVELSGGFVDAATATASYPDGTVTVASDGTRTLRNNQYGILVQASDGTTQTPESGVKSIEFKVDGQRKDYTEQLCADASCTLEYDWLFDAAAYAAGPHLVSVVVTDQLGHITTSTYPVNVLNEIGQCPGSVDYDVYWLGNAFEGMPMSSQARHCSPGDGVNAPMVGVATTYGDCSVDGTDDTETTDPHACQPPLQVFSGPMCNSQASQYAMPSGDGSEPDSNALTYDALTIRGVAAASFEEGTVIDIYTAGTTIKVMGEEPTTVYEAAKDVVGSSYYPGSDSVTDPTAPLPEPDDSNPYTSEGC